MRWRDIFFGAIATLAVTVVAGLVLWYLTRDPPRVAEIKYTTDDIVYFAGTPKQIGFVTVKVSNVGTKAAFDVRIILDFPSGTNIREKQITFSSSSTGAYNENTSELNIIDLFLPLLAPGEIISASVLIDNARSFKPEISVRGKEAVGTPGPIQMPSAMSGISVWKGILIVVGALFLQLVAVILGPRLGKRIQSLVPSVNNTAFMFIHKKMIDEAQELLSGRIKTKGADVYILSNYALVIGLNGDIEKAEPYFGAAEWWQAGNSELALIKFNRAILMAANGDYENAKRYLREAFSLSRGQTSRYCRFSDYISDAMHADAGLRELVTSKGRDRA